MPVLTDSSDMQPSLPRAMELLAPAGTLPAFEAALDAGADAVYVGAPGLNARALSRDFTPAEIMAMVDMAHERGKKLYLALNSLAKEGEIPSTLRMLIQLGPHWPDALIIQDLGLLPSLRRLLPDIPLHASTLMGANNSMAAELCRTQGLSRVVLARELSIREIAAIHQQSGIELEIFIHGAMCFSYSGLCRFSSLHGGRSSLRGRCVQPCRRAYLWTQGAANKSGKKTGRGKALTEGGHFFSMSDLCGLDHLEEIRKAGVLSLKIEGRLRSRAYVHHTVHAYRLALDSLDAPPDQRASMLAEAKERLQKAMARRLTSGFLPGAEEHKKIILPHLSGAVGELVGRTVKPERDRKAASANLPRALQILLQADLHLGDRLRFHEEKSGERLSFTLREMELKGKKVTSARAGQLVRLSGMDLAGTRPASAKAHGLLFRVDVAGRQEKISQELSRRITAMQKNVPAQTLATQAPASRTKSPDPPMARTKGRNQAKQHKNSAKTPQWWVHTPSLSALRTLHLPFPISCLLVDITADNLDWFRKQRTGGNQSASLIWALPPLILEQNLGWYQRATRLLREAGARAFQIGHWSQTALFADQNKHDPAEAVEIYGDYSLNVLNSASLDFWEEQGLAGIQFCLETDRHNLLDALARFSEKSIRKMRVGLLVHGRPPLFVARLDAPHFHGQRNLLSGRGERYYIERGPEFLTLRSPQPFSLLPFITDLKQSGLDYVVIDLRYGQIKKEAAAIIALLRDKDTQISHFSGNYTETLA